MPSRISSGRPPRGCLEVTVFRTQRIAFRPIQQEDLEWLLRLDSDPEVMRFISKGVATPRERMEQVLLPRILGYYRESPPQGFWAGEMLDGSGLMGWFHLRPDKFTPAEMELGYRLERRFWGRGLATEASSEIVRLALGTWGYPKVSARTLVTNVASQRVMQKSGLKFECEFTWGADALPEWSEEERRGVKYSALPPSFEPRR